MTKSSDYARKLKLMRKSEGLTQKEFSKITGIPLGTLKNYETNQFEAGLKVIELVIQHQLFTKYTLWLMTDMIAPESGQIAPALTYREKEKEKPSRPMDI
ncbi:helix-turn-helix transcriptional regulator [Candidatus Regiella endosymbiont of Tuberolachnus salignus]|uniref:helix-turn-helix domain-containing protein n=1 Tax=Candidatus Regiella endosymbiont of Tuberolachnus salignus TaxID=3077956 RepID=UPI0030CFD97B